MHADTAQGVLDVLTPDALASGMGDSTFTPPRPLDEPAVAVLAQTFAYNDGTAVVHDTIQYLVERSEHEEEWLEALARMSIPTTLIWGLHDTVSPPRVAAYIWNTYLMAKPGANEFWYLPGANHYLQDDAPDDFADVVTLALNGGSPDVPGALRDDAGAPILVDRSRPKLRSAADFSTVARRMSGVGYRLGVDLGTTFTAAAVARDRRATIVPLGTDREAMPTVVYVMEDGSTLVGEPATRAGARRSDPRRP